MNPEKQLEKIKKLFEMISEEYAKPEEIVAIFGAITELINKTKQELEQKMAQNKDIIDDSYSGLLADLNSLEKKNKSLSEKIDKIDKKIGVDKKDILERISKIVKEMKDLIPELPDLSQIEKRIGEIEAKIPEIPEELTPEQVREKLEILKGDERLDKSAVKGIEDLEKQIKSAGTGKTVGGGLSQMRADLRYTRFHGGASNIYVSATEPSSPEIGDLWVDTS